MRRRKDVLLRHNNVSHSALVAAEHRHNPFHAGGSDYAYLARRAAEEQFATSSSS